MPVDYQQLQDTHRLEGEVDQAKSGVKQLAQSRVDLIEGLPEYVALEEAKRAIEEAKARLKIAVRDNRDLAKLDVEIAEARFDLSDLREIESNTLVLYTQQTGRAVIKEHDRVRQIELRARISKRLLSQERLPIGINRHLGQHFPIPVGMKVEVNQGEG